jgi:hypothetical protein
MQRQGLVNGHCYSDVTTRELLVAACGSRRRFGGLSSMTGATARARATSPVLVGVVLRVGAPRRLMHMV